MGLFGADKYCKHCGKKAGLLSYTLADKEKLCTDCAAVIPDWADDWSSKWDYDDFADFLAYSKYSKGTLLPLFHETHAYKTIHLDALNGLFYLGNQGLTGDEPPLILRLRDTALISLDFLPEQHKEGILQEKVIGKVQFTLLQIITEIGEYSHIQLECHRAIAKNEKGRAKTERHLLRKDTLVYSDPEDLMAFEAYLMGAWGAFRIEDEPIDNGGPLSELEKALALFMLDDIDDLTLDELNSQRRRLMKAFHPDINPELAESYAQRINAAYDLLKANICK